MRKTKKLAFVAMLVLSPMTQGLAENLVTGGDASQDEVIFNIPESMEGSIHVGDPAPDGNDPDATSFLMTVIADREGRSIGFGVKEQIFIDTSLTYRVRLSVYSDGTGTLTAGGYAFDGTSGNPLKTTDDRVWEYGMQTAEGERVINFPTYGWVQLEATIGPEGSDADWIWLPEMLVVGVGMWITAPPETRVYIDDVSVEEIQ